MEHRLLGQHLDSNKAPDPFASYINIIGGFDTVELFILRQLRAECVGAHRFLNIILAPKLVGLIDLFGAGLHICLEANIALRMQKFDYIVAASPDSLHVFLCFLADNELELVEHQPLQTLQEPEENSFFLLNQALCKERIIDPVFGSVLGGQNNLTTEEAVAAVMQCGQCIVAKTKEPGV